MEKIIYYVDENSISTSKINQIIYALSNVVMVSKFSEAVKAYIKQEKKPPRIEGWKKNLT